MQKWPYLKYVQLPYIYANVDLLIGTNAPKLMEPWKVINSQGEGPYAVKTLLGWVVNGPLQGQGACYGKQGQPQLITNRISLVYLNELLVRQFNHDFPESSYEENTEM